MSELLVVAPTTGTIDRRDKCSPRNFNLSKQPIYLYQILGHHVFEVLCICAQDSVMGSFICLFVVARKIPILYCLNLPPADERGARCDFCAASTAVCSQAKAGARNRWRYDSMLVSLCCMARMLYVLIICIALTDSPPAIRHVMLPKETAKVLPKSRLLAEDEWRNLGVQQSRGWQHYAIHR